MTAALVDFTAFLCFFTLLVVDFVSVVDLVVSWAAAKAEPSIMERASATVVKVFMAVKFPFLKSVLVSPSIRETKALLNSA